MSAMTDEQLELEFKRQIYLCSGLGLTKMLKLVNSQFGKVDHDWKFYMNGTFCIYCGVSIGSGQECKR